MKMPYQWIAGLMTVGWLAACSPSSEASHSAATPPPAAEAASTPAATMAPDSANQTASATGVVQSLDQGAGTITIAHGPVASLGWPAMTMAFHASSEQLASVQPEQQVQFSFAAKGMEATLTSITPAQ